MKDEIFKQLLELVGDETSAIYDYFSIHNILFERKAKEIKTRSYGGYEINKLTGEFNQAINQKSTELLDRASKTFKESGRKLSVEQYEQLIQKCTKPFISAIDNFQKVFQNEFERDASVETNLEVLKGNTKIKINKHINALKIFINTKLDKALWWTAIGTVFAGLSLILSVIAIIIAN